MKTLYPILAGKKALDAAGDIVQGFDRRNTMRLAAKIHRETALLNMGAVVLDTVCTVINGMNERSTIRVESEREYERHLQIMQKAQCMEHYGASYYHDMTDEEKRRYHDRFIKIFES